jgi:PadR family transcriptional regulator PadR
MSSDRALRELRRGTVEHCVLALLRDRPMYGFELVQTLQEVGGLVTSLGTIYPLLARLRGDGLVTTSLQPSDAGPARRYYQITPAGQRALEEFIADWSAFRDAVDRLFHRGGTHDPGEQETGRRPGHRLPESAASHDGGPAGHTTR